MREQDIQRGIMGWLKAEGYWTCKVITANKSGVPDILACSPDGGFMAIEVKLGKAGRLSAIQQHQLSEIENRGGFTIVARSLQDVKDALYP